MPVTIRDIAGKLNVSHATVSRALNGRDDPFISDATRQRVLEAAREMGYVPNRHAQALVVGKTYTVGVVGIPLVSDFHGKVVYGIEAECISRGYHALLISLQHCAGNGVQWAIDMLLQHQVDGAILTSGATPGYDDFAERRAC
jgi:DNA-binding LacI/PurR family transcriptional regulator